MDTLVLITKWVYRCNALLCYAQRKRLNRFNDALKVKVIILPDIIILMVILLPLDSQVRLHQP